MSEWYNDFRYLRIAWIYLNDLQKQQQPNNRTSDDELESLFSKFNQSEVEMKQS